MRPIDDYKTQQISSFLDQQKDAHVMGRTLGFVAVLHSLWIIPRLLIVAAVHQPTPTIGLILPSQIPQSPNATISDDVVSDLASFGDGDPDLKVVPHFYNTRLDLTYCLLTATEAALLLALGNYEGLVNERMAFRFNESSSVEIEIIPEHEYGPGPRAIPWKFAVWALNESIVLMLKERKFRTAAFTIQYKDWDLGVILYSLITGPRSDTLPFEVSNSTVMNLTKSKTANGTNTMQKGDLTGISNITTNLKAHPDLDLRFLLTGVTLALTDIFLAVLDMLRDLAHFNPATRLVSNFKRIGSADLIYILRDPNSPPRTSRHPPYLQAEWVMRALAQTPVHMVQQQDFREVGVSIYVDDLKIGEVTLIRTRRPSNVGVDDI